MKITYSAFLRDVFILAVSAFGGPQAHLALFFNVFVKKRKLLTEEDLIELNALCQILPGPTSTQTITAIGFKLGGPNLAYLTLLIWMIPAFTVMTFAAILIANFQQNEVSLSFTKYIQPIAVGFVAHAAFIITQKVIRSGTGLALAFGAIIVSYFIRSPYIFPLLLIGGGAVTAFKFKKQPFQEKEPMHVNWSNFILWATIFISAAILGGITQSLLVRLFENFYRNGSLIFGGGQVLIPLLYTEFVEFKNYLTSEEFLSGFAIVQSVPGPTFSFSAYIGALTAREYGVEYQILAGFFAAAGIFLPGTFFIYFVIRFWDELKKYRVVKASLEGVNAVSAGMVIAAVFLLFQPIENSLTNFVIVITTFGLLRLTIIPAPLIILAGIIAGIFI